MKERSEEKIRNGKPNEKKATNGNWSGVTGTLDKSKAESFIKSKIDLKKAKTKNFASNEPEALKLKGNKPKSKSSCFLETIDVTKCNKKGENSDAYDAKINLKKEALNSVSSKEKVLEKIKKNKSLDHVGKISSRNLSKASLAKKVSDVLQQVKSPKTSSYVDLLRANSKTSSSHKTLLPNASDNCTGGINFFAINRNTKLQNFTDGQMMAGKSLSFDSLKFFNGAKQLSKCFSVENGKNVASDKPIGVFNVYKKSYNQTSDAFVKKINLSEPLWNYKGYSKCQPLTKMENGFNVQKILKSSSQIPKMKAAENSSSNKTAEYQNCRGFQNEERAFEYRDLESFLKNAKPPFQTLDPAKRYNDQSWQDSLPEKKTVRICQCLHFHTEDGFKKLSLQNNTATKEFGQKFFRVNYFSKKECENNEQTESRAKLVDKETTTEDEAFGLRSDESKKSKFSFSSQKTNQKPILNKKVSARLKPISKNYVKANDKKQEVRKKDKIETNFVLWRGGNQMQILGKSKFLKKPEPSFQKISTEAKAKKQAAEFKERKRLERSAEASKEKALQQKALDELEVLEKLFLKLNSVENSLFRHKSPVQQKMIRKYPEDKKLARVLSKKGKATLQNLTDKSCPVLTDIETEEEYLQRRNKLRNAILRHVQNFLKLDFSDI